MTRKTPDVSDAYAAASPNDLRRLYADWADSYDESFARSEAYLLPGLTARAFAQAGGQGPVLDVGAGTGLCGVALSGLRITPVDAADISPDMLAQALRKDVYRDVIEADLYEGIPVPRASYAGVVSSGTFTHGHLGPEVLPAILRVTRPGALLAMSINAAHYQKAGFAEAFDRLLRGQWISNLSLPEVRIYGGDAGSAHHEDTALIALFQKV